MHSSINNKTNVFRLVDVREPILKENSTSSTVRYGTVLYLKNVRQIAVKYNLRCAIISSTIKGLDYGETRVSQSSESTFDDT